LPEANFLVFFLNQFKNKQSLKKEDILLIFEQIELYGLSHLWVGWQFDLEMTKNECLQLITKQSNITYPQLCTIIYRNFKVLGADKQNAEMLIDKNPSYTIFATKISKVFPNAKFIWIVRDYRANILSRKQSVYLKSPNIAYNATRWKLYNEAAYSFFCENPNKTILIKYEDLIEKNEIITKQLEAFLNIKPDFEVDNFEQSQIINLDNYQLADKFKERFVKKYSDLNKTLNSNRLNAWKEQLTKDEIKLCDAICQPSASKIGYEPMFEINRFKKIKYILNSLKWVCLGHVDIFKDKILYYFNGKIKIKRLKKKYIELGFITK